MLCGANFKMNSQMKNQQKQIAQQCHQGAENNSMDFPEIVKQLIQTGFDRYSVDFCKSTISYYLPCGDNLTLDFSCEKVLISEKFNSDTIKKAICAAQMKVEKYTYSWFCKCVMEAGCTGYLVSFLGKRVVYFGRTGEIHVEYFPIS